MSHALFLFAALSCTPPGQPPARGPDDAAPVPPVDGGSGAVALGSDAGVRVRDAGMPAGSDHEAILAERAGFGRNARGGSGGELCLVTTLADRGAGSLRDCATRTRPTWVRFTVSGVIELDSELRVSSFTTIDGRGANVTISKSGLAIYEAEHVIVMYVTFDDGDGYVDWRDVENTIEGNDAIVIRRSHDVWIHRSSFSRYGDGLADMRDDATDVTVSWCRFSEHVKVMLVNAGSELRLTTHHNVFERTGKRHPRILEGRLHAFNNFHTTFVSFAVGSGEDAQVLSEGNVYVGDEASSALATELTDTAPGNARSEGDVVRDGADIHERNPDSVFDASDFYDYEVEPAGDALVARLREQAGFRETPFPE